VQAVVAHRVPLHLRTSLGAERDRLPDDRRLGRREEAFEALKRATSLDPKLSRPHYLLAGLYLARGDQEASNRELTTFASLQTIPEEKLGY